MKRQIHDLIGLLLIGALFLIEIPRYAETLPDRSQLVAVGMGLLLSGGAFYTIETWGMLKRKRGTPRGTNRLLAMTALLVVAAPVIMTPAMVALQNGVSTNEVLSALGDYTEELVWLFIVTVVPVATGVFVAYARSLQYSSDELNEPRKVGKLATLRQVDKPVDKLPPTLRQPDVSLDMRVNVDRLLDAMRANPGASLRQMAERLGVSATTVGNWRQAGVQIGKISHDGNGNYRIAEEEQEIPL